METNDSTQLACPNCSHGSLQEIKFCTACGYPIGGTEEEINAFRSNKLQKELSLEEVESKIRSARKTLFVAGTLYAAFGSIYALVKMDDDETSAVSLLIGNIALGAIFIALGYWCSRKPLAAIITALIIFASVTLLDTFVNPMNIIKGILVKIILVSYLVKGLMAAREAEQLKKELALE